STELKRLKKEIAELDKILADIKPRLKVAEGQIRAFDKDMNNLTNEMIEVDKELVLVAHQMRTATEIEGRLAKVGAVCPTCKHKVDEKHLANEVKKLTTEINALEKLKTSLLLAKNAISADQSKIIIKITAADSTLNAIKIEETKAKGHLN